MRILVCLVTEDHTCADTIMGVMMDTPENREKAVAWRDGWEHGDTPKVLSMAQGLRDMGFSEDWEEL